MRPVGLVPLVGDAVVPDHRSGEADELLRVARVGHRLLVAGHRGREHRLAEGGARRADRSAAEDRSVLESEIAGSHATNTSRPSATVRTTRPRSVLPRSHEFAESERNPSSVTSHSASRSSATRFARAPASMRGSAQTERPRRPRRHAFEQRLQVELSSQDEVRVQRRERRLEARDAERRVLERHVLLVTCMWRVIRGDRADRTVAERLEECDPVVLGAERRVHLEVRVERAHRVVRQAEVVRRDLGGRFDARLACSPQGVAPTPAPTGA